MLRVIEIENVIFQQVVSLIQIPLHRHRQRLASNILILVYNDIFLSVRH